MFEPGDVVWLFSKEANKPKYHLCVSKAGYFLYISSPNRKEYPGNLVFPCSDFDCIPANDSGKSVVSCTLPIPYDDAKLKKLRAKWIGRVDARVLIKLMAFVEDSAVLSQEEKEIIIQGLVDWA